MSEASETLRQLQSFNRSPKVSNNKTHSCSTLSASDYLVIKLVGLRSRSFAYPTLYCRSPLATKNKNSRNIRYQFNSVISDIESVSKTPFCRSSVAY